MGIQNGRVAIVTGAGNGIGRGHALEFARQGAKVVVNDLGSAIDGTGSSPGPAGAVVDEIRAMGSEAIANGENVADWEGARRMVQSAIDQWGKLDVLVCNAGILRDRMLFNMDEAEWDAVINVHMKGTFAPARHAAAYWREQNKRGEPVDAAIVTTSSTSGLFGNPGQTNYGAAKAGNAAFAIIAARELERYGVRVNSIAPAASTRLTETIGMARGRPGGGPGPTHPDGWSPMDPENIAPLVVWLTSPEAKDVNGRVFLVQGGSITLLQGWSRVGAKNKDGRWDPATEVGPVVQELLATAPQPTGMRG